MKINIFVPAALTLCLAAAPLCAQDAAPPAADAPEETIPIVPAVPQNEPQDAIPLAPVIPPDGAGNARQVAVGPRDPAFEKMTPDEQKREIGRRMSENMTRLMSLTPEQMALEVRKIERMTIRSSLSRAGYDTPLVQDSVLLFLDEQETARATVRNAAYKMYSATEPNGTRLQRGATVAPTEMFGLVNDYLAAVEAEKARRMEAEKALDAKINFSADPKLRAVLLLHGFIGDAAWFTGGNTMGQMAIGSLAQSRASKPTTR